MRAAWAWENRKARNRWYWPMLAVLGAVGMALGWSQYTSYRAEFPELEILEPGDRVSEQRPLPVRP